MAGVKCGPLQCTSGHACQRAQHGTGRYCTNHAGNPDTLNWLFAADRDALRAMVSLMRSADMDAARLGLQVGKGCRDGPAVLIPDCCPMV